MHRTLHNVLVLKAILSVGFIGVIFLPEGWKSLSALAINLIWLWKVK